MGKCLVISFLLALVLSLSLPAVPTSANPGTELSPPSPISLGTFTTGDNTGNSAGEVVTDKAGWSLSATDQNTTAETKGYMLLADNSTAPDAKLQISKEGSSYIAADGTLTYYDANGPVDTTQISLYVKQAITALDPPGAYSLTVKYTLTPAE